MTNHQRYQQPGHGTPSEAHVDDDEVTSPSDGYFGQRSSVPNTVFIANPESQSDAAMSKAKEADTGKGSPLPTHQPIYTPDTTATPAGSSRRDSSSTYSGYGSRYPEAVPDRDDDPPPMYSDTPTNWSQGQQSPAMAQPQVQPRDAPALTRARVPPSTIPPNTNTSRPIPQPSRSYRQVETSSSISGTYELLDLLDLSTTSGSISVTVVPKPAGPDNAPAVLKLRSVSGSINIRFSPSAGSTPDRLYQTSLSAQSGSISGTITVNGAGEGGKASISTRSGAINLNVFPVLSPNTSTQYTGAAILETSSNSGSQSVTVKSPNRPGYLTDLAGSHTAIGSANLNIVYPREWKGIVHAKSIGTGSVGVKGEGLEYQLKSSREVYAWRGKSGEEVETVEILGKGSGSLGFVC